MRISALENKLLGKLAAALPLIVTITFWTAGTDPFNLPKMFLLSLGAGAMFGISLSRRRISERRVFNPFNVAILIFFGLLISFLLADAPKVHMFYGVYGRNTGFLTYTALILVFLSVLKLRRREEFQLLLYSLIAANVFNLLLCTLEILGKNPQRVAGTFKDSLIGSFGNPNFVSAFLGITGGVYFFQILNNQFSIFFKVPFIVLGIYSAYLIIESNSIQGLIVLLGSIGLGLGIFLYSKARMKLLFIGYLILMFCAVAITSFGVFNKGPLADLIYKSSLGFRIEYWKAGLEMFKNNFFFGVGPNSYGDWYRYYRSDAALISPGDRVTTNSAHNIYIDFGATNGVLFVLGYILLIGLILFTYIEHKRVKRDLDPLLDSFFIAWVAYLVQGLVSIDQIGLSIWGWVLPAAVYGYIKSIPVMDSEKSIKKKKSEMSELLQIKYYLASLIGLGLAFCITFPIMKSDINMNRAYGSASGYELIESALAWPRNEFKIGDTGSLLLRDGNQAASLDVLLQGASEFPRSFGIWTLIYLNPASSPSDKEKAMLRLQALDPKNKNIIKAGS
jgi:O-antigen ligase